MQLKFTMKRMRVVLVEDSKRAGKGLAHLELCHHQLRAEYLSR